MKNITDFPQEISEKTALVRCNFDVPIVNGRVEDTTRIEDAIDTINFLQQNKCQIILIAHQDRPQGKFVEDNSLQPVSTTLRSILKTPITFVPYQDMRNITNVADRLVLLDNLRFFSQEKGRDQDFAEKLAGLADFYVNESFATAHRDHTSITLLPKLLPAYIGISFAKEIDALNKILDDPQKPLVLIIGGAKITTKEPLINAFKDRADSILVGGKIALDLQGVPDIPQNVLLADLTPTSKDITKESAHKFAHIIESAGTVIWNGTMGVFEEPPNHIGTEIIAKSVNNTSAFTLVGGGDTEAALTKLDAETNISHISSGGGAMLTYLSNRSLVAIDALNHE